MLVRMLIAKGFACREAEDGMAALCEVSRVNFWKSVTGAKSGAATPVPPAATGNPRQNFTIDAVLIDSNMPRMNGPDAVVEMRKIGYRGPIIGVSGGDNKSLKEFLDAGADDTMQKPAQSDKLVNMLLTGLELVVHKETSRQTSSDGNDGNLSASETLRQDYIAHLRKFLDVCKRVVIK